MKSSLRIRDRVKLISASSRNNPPFAVRLRRMGHRVCLVTLRICGAAQLQNHAPLVRFAKAPVPPPLQTQAEGFAAEHEDGVATLQSAQ